MSAGLLVTFGLCLATAGRFLQGDVPAGFGDALRVDGLALLGTVLLFASGQGQLGEGLSALHWTRFMEAAPRLHPFTLRLGVVFALIGYGTKAGLAPMHTWKPDAYREAPSPAVALMAVGMVNGALYCLLRVHLISKAALGAAFSGDLLLVLGLLSVLIAMPFILIQWNLKRLLA